MRPIAPFSPRPAASPMCDVRRYRSLFLRRRVAPPTPPPPSPPLSDVEPSAETYNPATELVGDPDEPHVAEHVPYGAPEAYFSDALIRFDLGKCTESYKQQNSRLGIKNWRLSFPRLGVGVWRSGFKTGCLASADGRLGAGYMALGCLGVILGAWALVTWLWV
ncbi:hypothetical protein PIB30_026876 [Stylosanthes scabra]|uniref:Uncharacterized protein n=1 Tax=Stylosanthes scabra TaxID=79078 RepID=A0ABU6UD51_9FABA|nr:hypothetical protein [Stylosanthes scabra]